MSLRKTLLIFTLAVSLGLVVLLVPTDIPHLLVQRSALETRLPEYARPGPYLVGIQTVAVEDGPPLPLTIWYPCLRDGQGLRKMRYPYPIKMGEPLGTVSITSYTGESFLDAPIDHSEAPYPTIILSPGFAVGTSAYAWLAEHLASYGFVVIAVEHQEGFDNELDGLWRGTITRPQDILAVLAYLDHEVRRESPLAGLLDVEQVALVGHSYGGYTALASAGAQIDTASFEMLCESAYESNDPNVLLCDEVLPHLEEMAELARLESVPEGLWPSWADPRIDAIIPLAGDALFFGQPGLAKMNIPVLAIGGTLDIDSPYMWGTYPTYEYASSPIKTRIALLGAEHMIFTGPCERSSLAFSLFTGEFCSDSKWDRQKAHDLTNHFATAFLLAIFSEDAAAAEALRLDHAEFPNVEYVSEGF